MAGVSGRTSGASRWIFPSRRAGVSPQYLFFGGKGGAGKTTCAGSAAVALAEQGRHVLVVSTDPAHSLGDILGRRLTALPAAVRIRRGHLTAWELDADRALVRWLAQRRPALTTIFERGTILERADIDPFLNLSLPGVDELLGLLEIERLAGQEAYDQVVIDTAPAGHTLRLLSTPALISTFARILDAMQEKHRVLAAAFARGQAADDAEALIVELARDGERLGALLRDPSRMRLCWVVLPEEMSMAQSTRAVAALCADGIRVTDIIVNRLTPQPPTPCALCDGRRRSEAEWLSAIAAQWGNQRIGLWTLPARDEPPQGIAALREVAENVSPLARAVAPGRRSRVAKRPEVTQRRPVRLPTAVRPSRSTRVLIVGGKGGVGKSTCAATLALAVARTTPDRRVLLVSTDPAPSIGDVLGQPVGAAERRIRSGPANLVAREIDAARAWREWRERYRASIEHLFTALTAGSNVDLTVDRKIVEQLFDLAPPGMDEIVGMLAILDAVVPDVASTTGGPAAEVLPRFDLVIVDSAPTGHTLRLLALPVQAHAWVRQLMAVVVKYKAAPGFGQLASELVSLSRGLKRLQALLTDALASGVIVVTRPEHLPSLQTLRLAEWLRRHRMARRALIVNGMTPEGCVRCRRIAARERRQIASFASQPAWTRSGCAIVVADAVAPPPRGVAALSAWAHSWRPWRK